jgi:hypothetical protein
VAKASGCELMCQMVLGSIPAPTPGIWVGYDPRTVDVDVEVLELTSTLTCSSFGSCHRCQSRPLFCYFNNPIISSNITFIIIYLKIVPKSKYNLIKQWSWLAAANVVFYLRCSNQLGRSGNRSTDRSRISPQTSA